MFNRIKFANVVVLKDNELTGDIKGTGGIIIGGLIHGIVSSKCTELDKKGLRMGFSSGKTNAIHILKGGVVKGHVTACHVIIDGRVEGNVDCEHLEIGKHGELVGDASYRLSKVANGAYINGSMNPTRKAPSEEDVIVELKIKGKKQNA